MFHVRVICHRLILSEAVIAISWTTTSRNIGFMIESYYLDFKWASNFEQDVLRSGN